MPDELTDDVVLATIREFAEATGTTRLSVIVDRGPDNVPPLVEVEDHDVTISQGDERYVVPPSALIAAEPLELDLPKAVPATAIDVDVGSGRIEAPLGALDALAGGLLRLAIALGGRTAAIAEYATRNGEDLSIAARDGEPLILAMGEHQFELPQS